MNHTKEPWHYEINGFSRAILLGDKLTSIGYISDIVNAKRIVACVNACAGITNEALEAGVVEWSVNIANDATNGDLWKGNEKVKIWEDV